MKLTPKVVSTSYDPNFVIGGSRLEYVLGRKRMPKDSWGYADVLDCLKTKALIESWGFKVPRQMNTLIDKSIEDHITNQHHRGVTGTNEKYHGLEFTDDERRAAMHLDAEDPPKGSKLWFYRYFFFVVGNSGLLEEEILHIVKNVDFGMILKYACPSDIKEAIHRPFEITGPEQMKRVMVANAYLRGDLEMHESFKKHITWEVLDSLTNKQFKALMEKFSFFPYGEFNAAKVQARIFSTLMDKTGTSNSNAATRLKEICYFLSSEKRYIIWKLLDCSWFPRMAIVELEMSGVKLTPEQFAMLDNASSNSKAAVEFLEANPIPQTMKFAKENGQQAVDYETKTDVKTETPAVAPSPAEDALVLAASPA